jgi:hypothetical protein
MTALRLIIVFEALIPKEPFIVRIVQKNVRIGLSTKYNAVHFLNRTKKTREKKGEWCVGWRGKAGRWCA